MTFTVFSTSKQPFSRSNKKLVKSILIAALFIALFLLCFFSFLNQNSVGAEAASSYTVSYNFNGGTNGANSPTSWTSGTAQYVSAPTRAGYTFTGWTVTSGLNSSTAKWGTSSSPSTAISSSSTLCVNGASGNVYFKDLTSGSSATLTANWTGASYTVTYNDMGGATTTTTSTVTFGSTYNNLLTPTRAGYTFKGWKLLPSGYQQVEYIKATNGYVYIGDQNPGGDSSMRMEASLQKVTGNQNFWCARDDYTANTFTLFAISNQLRFDYNASAGSAYTTITENKTYVVSAEKNRGWVSNNGSLSALAVHNKASFSTSYHLYFMASYVKNASSCENFASMTLYNATYWSSGGTATACYIPCYETSGSGRTGLYDIVGKKFYPVSDTSKFTRGNSVNYISSTTQCIAGGGITVYADWTANSYKINYDTEGGDTLSSTSAIFGSYYGTLSTPTKTGYTFKGWRLLPTEYQQVLYITTSGAGLVKVEDIIPSGDSSMRMVVSLNNTNNQNLWCARGTTTNTLTFTMFTLSTGHPRFDYYYTTPPNASAAMSTGTIYTLSAEKNVGWLDNTTLVYAHEYASYECGGPLVFMTSYQNGAVAANYGNRGYMNMYGATYWVNDEVVAYFVPCYRKSDNKVGLYDIVRDKFYAGEGTLSAGDAVSYITSSTGFAVGRDVTLHAVWQANTYTVNYASYAGGTNGNSTMPTSWTYDVAQAVPTPTRAGYTFAGWRVTSGLNTSTGKYGNTSSTVTTSISSSSTQCVNTSNPAASVYLKNLNATNGGTVSLTATWVGTEFTITYDTQGGNSLSSKTVNFGSAYGVTEPTKTGYTFNGWRLLPIGYQQVEYIQSYGAAYILIDSTYPTANSSMRMVATLTSDLGGNNTFWCSRGDGHENSFTFFSTGSNFRYDFGKLVEQYSPSALNTKYTVTAEKNRAYVNGNLITNTNMPTYTGNQYPLMFLESYSGNPPASHLNGSNYAYIQMYSATYWNNGSIVAHFVPCYRKSDNKVGLYDIVRNTFYAGSYSGDGLTAHNPVYITSTTEFAVGKDVTLYADWAVNNYTANYNYVGGTYGGSSTPPSAWTYDVAQEVLAPTRAGYTFAGWQVTSGLNASVAKYGNTSLPATSISANTACINTSNSASSVYFKNLTGDKNGSVTLTATWKANTFTVTYNAQGGTVSPSSKSVTFGSSYGTLATPTKTGYSFAGWRLLPTEYQQVEYIESHGGEYVLTDITPNGTSSMRMVFAVSEVITEKNYALWCSRGTALADTSFSMFFMQPDMMWYNYNNGRGDWTEYSPNIPEGEMVVVSAERNSGWVYDGTYAIHSHTKSGFASSSDRPLMFLTSYINYPNNNYLNNLTNPSRIKMYGATYWENGNIVAYFVPCYRKSDEKIGLYDIVGGNFYEGKTTGSGLTKGNNVYITSATEFAVGKNVTLYADWTLNDISVTSSSQPTAIDKTYDGTNGTLTYTVSHLLNNVTYQWYNSDNSVVSGEMGESLSYKDVNKSGSYYCIATVTDGVQTVTATSDTVALTISKRTVSLNWTAPADLVYSGTAKVPTVACGNVVSGETVTATADLSVGKDNINVGSFTYTVSTISDTGNYALSENVTSPSYTITKKTVSLAWTAPADLVYSGTAKVPTVAVNNLCGSDSCAVTIALSGSNENANINVGDFTFTATELSNTNYTLTGAEDTVSSVYTITKKMVSLAWTAPADLVYSGTAKTPTVAVDNLCGSDTCTVTIALSGSNENANINVGDFTFTATELSNANYTLTGAEDTVSSVYTITQKPVSLDWTAPSDLVYSGTAKVPTVAVNNLCGSDTCTVTIELVESRENANINVGDFTFTATELSNANYTLTGAEDTVSSVYTITQKPVSFDWTTPESLVYSGTAKVPTVAVNNLCGSDVCSVTASLTENNDNVNAGNFTFTVTAIGNGNYTLPADEFCVSPTYTISRKNIAGATIELKAQKKYNGQAQTQEVESVTIDDLTLSLSEYDVSDNVQTNVGTSDYVLTVTAKGNFVGTETKTWNIGKKDIADAEVTLGGALTYNGEIQEKGIVSVLIGDLNVTYTVDGNCQKNAGEYVMTLSGTGNYGGNKAVSFTIAKKALTVTANNSEIVYGQPPAGSGVSYTGLVTGDVLGGELDYDYTYTRYEDVGEYSLTPKGLTSGNYLITFVAGVLTVRQKSVTATVTADSVTYGSVVQASASFGEGVLENGDVVPILLTYKGTGDTVYEESATKPEQAGTYVLYAKVGNEGKSKNYAMVITKQFQISKAEYNIYDVIDFEDMTFTYDGREHLLAVRYLKEGSGLVVSYTNNGRTEVGSQTVTASFSGYDESNYIPIGDMTAELTIEGRNISGADVTLGSALTYNGNAQTQLITGVSITFDIDGTDVTLEVDDYTVTDNVQTNADSYNLRVTGGGNFTGYQTVPFTIQPKNISGATIELKAQKIYNGLAQMQEVESVTIDELTLSSSEYDVTGNVQTDVGTSDYVLTVTASGNFIGTATKTWNIGKKYIAGATVALDTTQLIYSGVLQQKEVTSVTISDLPVDFDVEDDTGIVAGNYTLRVVGKGNFCGTETVNFSIAKKPLTVTANGCTITYGDNANSNGVSFSGFVSGEDESVLSGVAAFSYNYQRYEGVGNYAITPSGFTADNYEIIYQNGVLTVEPYEVTLTWGTETLRYTGNAQRPSVTAGVLNGDSYVLTVTDGYTDAGSNYIATVTAIDNANYVLPASCSHPYVILPALVTPPVAQNRTYTYSGSLVVFAFESFDDLTCTATNNTRVGSGSQTVYVELNDKDNYCWTDGTTTAREYTFTVDKLMLTPPVLASKEYTGELLTADVAAATYYTVTENAGGVHVGQYAVTFTFKSAYAAHLIWLGTEGTSATSEFSITQATNEWVGEIVAPIAITYGEELTDPTANAKFGEASYLYRLQSGTDDDYTDQKPTNAGDYYLLLTIDGTDDYTGLTERREFRIDKADLDGSALHWEYTEAYTYDGETKSVALSGVPDGVEAILSDNEKIHAGSYTASVVFRYDTDNYNAFSFVDCVWTIEPKQVSVEWENLTLVYDGQIKDLPRAFYVNIDGEDVSLAVAEKDGKDFMAAGSYLFSATGDDTDYRLSGEEQAYEIAKKKVSKPVEDEREFFCTGETQVYGILPTPDYAVENNERADGGSQNVIVRLTDSLNCEWQDGTTEDLTFTFTILHRFSEHNGDLSKLSKSATCTEKAVYYAVCACGEREEYEFGAPLGHDYQVAFRWRTDNTAQAHVTCSGCDFEAEEECDIEIKMEEQHEYCYATLEFAGTEYSDRKIKGAAVYENNVYDYPVWAWTSSEGEYDAKAVFVAIDDEALVREINAEITFIDEEKFFVLTATVYFGDENKEFTDQRKVDKYCVTVQWTEQNTATYYVRPYTDVNVVLERMPSEDRVLYALCTGDGVYLLHTDGDLPKYDIVRNETLTALWIDKGTLTLTATDEDGNLLADVFFELGDGENNLFEGSSTEDKKSVTFRHVPYGLYKLRASFTLSGKQIERVFTVDVDGSDVSRQIVLTQDKVNTTVVGKTICDDLEKIAAVTDSDATVTLVLDTAQTLSENIIKEFNKVASAEAHDQKLYDFRNLTVTEKVKTVDEDGRIKEDAKDLSSSSDNITLKFEIGDEIYDQLISRNGSPSDIVVYLYETGSESVVKLPKKEFAHEATQYYSVVTSSTKPYVLLSVNAFGAVAIGIQTTVVQAVNEILSLSISNWVYGKEASTPVSDAKYGNVKYAYAQKGINLFSPTVPTNAGTYYLKAYVEAEEEYSGAEQIVEFTIEKATYRLKVTFNDRKVLYDGSEYSLEIKGELPEGVRVVYEKNVASDMGEYKAIAHFYGDSENYNLIPDQTATLTIEDKTAHILKTYLWVFVAGGVLLLGLLIAFVLRVKFSGKGGGLMFNYRD